MWIIGWDGERGNLRTASKKNLAWAIEDWRGHSARSLLETECGIWDLIQKCKVSTRWSWSGVEEPSLELVFCWSCSWPGSSLWPGIFRGQEPLLGSVHLHASPWPSQRCCDLSSKMSPAETLRNFPFWPSYCLGIKRSLSTHEGSCFKALKLLLCGIK